MSDVSRDIGYGYGMGMLSEYYPPGSWWPVVADVADARPVRRVWPPLRLHAL